MSIQASLSRWFAVLTFIGLSIVCTGVYVTTRWSFHNKQAEEFARHEEVVQRVLQEVAQPPDIPLLRHKLSDYFVSHTNVAVSLWAGGKPLYESNVKPESSEWKGKAFVVPRMSVDGHALEVRMSVDVGSDITVLRRLAWTLSGAAILGTLIVSLTGALLVRRGLQPLKRLAEETAAAGPDRPGHQIDAISYAKELRPWIAQFNALLARVETAYAQLEAFNADVAHELRTPLSNMIAQAEVELGRERNESELKEVLESQLEEARRLTGIVADMLFLSRADRGVKARRDPATSLAAQVAAVAEFQEAVLEEAGLTLVIDGESHLAMDIGLVRRAVSNLISNAQRYADRGSTLRVAIERDENATRLLVQNKGPAIRPDALPRLFERFYRADESRSGSATHHGLGLAIVAAIARMHDGETFASCRDGITTVGVSLRESSPPTVDPATPSNPSNPSDRA
jgi:two-component system heavy metal sensor histidine kinase CusS